jgi:glutamate--cysteine ligase
MTTPHLQTALSGELAHLERTLVDATAQIERWFRMQWQEHTPPFYGSVDVRNAGYKIAPVDTNLFPGGFNNLSAEMVPMAVMAAQAGVDKYCPDARNLLLIPENHTRNTYYLQNVYRLTQILRQTGLVVRLGTLNPEITAPTELTTAEGQTLTVEPLIRFKHGAGQRLGLAGFDPCMVLLNNDLTSAIPEILRGLDSQIVLPPLHGGWAVRRKTNHFAAYDSVAKAFAKELNIDDWLINPYFAKASGIDFSDGTGVAALQDAVSDTLAKIRVKYAEYDIKEEPFLIVKADAGTYGMGIMQVKSPDDVASLNRKQRNKMSVIKEGAQVHEVIVQEGVPTIEVVNGGAAEPVVYMIDRFVVGGFYRVNTARGRDENLNAPGMTFQPLAFEKPCNVANASAPADCDTNRFYTYGVVGRLALLAASQELEQTAHLLGANA